MMQTNCWAGDTALLNLLFKRKWSSKNTIGVFRAGAGPVMLSLSALQDMVERVASWLAEMGLGPGDRIGILSGNRLEYVLLDLAALRLGIVTAGFDPAAFAGRSDLAESYDLKRLFFDKQRAGSQSAAKNAIPIEQVPVATEAGADTGLPPPATYAADDVCTIKFTSGSTGMAKALGATVGSIVQSIQSTQKMFHHGPGDRLMVFLPLSLLQQRYWIYSAILFSHDIVVADSRTALEVIQQQHPTVIMGVPAFFDTLKEFIEMEAGFDGSAEAIRQAAQTILGKDVRYLWTGSAAARPDMLEFFDTKCGVPIYEGYGLNETCITTKNHPGAHKRGSAGQPLDGVRIEIGSDGLIRVFRDYPVNDHYLYAPEGASEKVFMPDGSVATGDLGYIDEDGFLYVLGRADDVVVLTNGKTISVRPLEEQILLNPGVSQAVVIGTGRPVLAALVCPVSGADEAETRAAVLASGRAQTSENVERVIFAAEGFTLENGLLTSQGKLRRRAILERYKTEIQQCYGETG